MTDYWRNIETDPPDFSWGYYMWITDGKRLEISNCRDMADLTKNWTYWKPIFPPEMPEKPKEYAEVTVKTKKKNKFFWKIIKKFED